MNIQRRIRTDDEKRDLIDKIKADVLTGVTISKACKRFDVPTPCYYDWVKLFSNNETKVIVHNVTRPNSSGRPKGSLNKKVITVAPTNVNNKCLVIVTDTLNLKQVLGAL